MLPAMPWSNIMHAITGGGPTGRVVRALGGIGARWHVIRRPAASSFAVERACAAHSRDARAFPAKPGIGDGPAASSANVDLPGEYKPVPLAAGAAVVGVRPSCSGGPAGRGTATARSHSPDRCRWDARIGGRTSLRRVLNRRCSIGGAAETTRKFRARFGIRCPLQGPRVFRGRPA